MPNAECQITRSSQTSERFVVISDDSTSTPEHWKRSYLVYHARGGSNGTSVPLNTLGPQWPSNEASHTGYLTAFSCNFLSRKSLWKMRFGSMPPSIPGIMTTSLGPLLVLREPPLRRLYVPRRWKHIRQPPTELCSRDRERHERIERRHGHFPDTSAPWRWTAEITATLTLGTRIG